MQRNYTEDARAFYFPPADAPYHQNRSNRHNRSPLIHYASRQNPERIAPSGGYTEQVSHRIYQPNATRIESRNMYGAAQLHGPEISSTRPPLPIRHFHSYPVNDNPSHRELLRSQEEIGRSLTYPPQHHTLDHRWNEDGSRQQSRRGVFEGRRPHPIEVEEERIYDPIPSNLMFPPVTRRRHGHNSLNYPGQRADHSAVGHRRGNIESPPRSPDMPSMGSLHYPTQGTIRGVVNHQRADIESPPSSPDVPSISIDQYEYSSPSDDRGPGLSSSMRPYISDEERMRVSVGATDYLRASSSVHDAVPQNVFPQETSSLPRNEEFIPFHDVSDVHRSRSDSDDETLLSPLNPPEPLDRASRMQRYCDNLSYGPSSNNSGLAEWERSKIREIFLKTVPDLEESFLPSYIRNNLPTRLLRIRTMKLLSMDSQDSTSVISARLRGIAKAQIQSLVEMETPDIISYLREAMENEGCYAILSHRWCSSEVTFKEIQQLANVTFDAVEELLRRCQRNRYYFKERSIFTELLETARAGPSSPNATPGEDIIDALAKLIQTADLHSSHINAGFKKLVEFCHVSVVEHGAELAWIDTCCIDKSSSSELDESIRSMFRWYRNSSICLIHLGATSDTEPLRNDPWFRRGWTLQELLAPKTFKFYDAGWNSLTRARRRQYKIQVIKDGDTEPGESESDPESDHCDSSTSPNTDADESDETYIIKKVSEITKIPLDNLLNFEPGLKDIRTRLGWAAQRETTRIEDQAYSLLGIFDITMPIAYGEGKNAFYRLQEAIMQRSNDRNMFLWSGTPASGLSLLASSPKCFSSVYDTIEEDVQHADSSASSNPPPPHFTLTNHGLSIALSLYDDESTDRWMEGVVECDRDMEYRLAVLGYAQHGGSLTPVFMLLTKHRERGHVYYRRHPWTPSPMPQIDFPEPSNVEVIYIR